MKNTIKTNKQRRLAFWIIIVVALLLLVACAGVFYSYASNQLYQESIEQLTEISEQLFERLDIQLNLQWDYLNKIRSAINEKGTLTQAEVIEIFTHFEDDLAPIGKTIKFRLIDEDGYYYTDQGRQGSWTGKDKLNSELQYQSFLISNQTDNENYMTFVYRANLNIVVDGHKITHFVLLRSMTDMQEFFHSSAFDNKNIAYIVDDDGFILYQNGTLEGIDYKGTNAFSYFSEQKFNHETISEITSQVDNDEIVCTDVKVGDNMFYIVYNRLQQYDWGVLLVMSSNDVAVNTGKMVQSLVRLFAAFLILFVAVMIVGMLFMVRIQRDRVLIATKVENEKVLNEANHKLEETNKELQISQQETEKALEVAKYATKAKSQFLANMSHDIRTPMNAIVGVTKLMEHEIKNPEKLTYYINKLRHSSQYMLGLINDILDMSKIESGDVHLNLEPVKVAEQVGQIESIIRSQANEKNQDFKVVVHEITHEYLIGDSIRLRQIFINLLSNAVKYTPDGGKIRFELQEMPCENPDCTTILTSVIDNGIGMSEEFQRHMFEPFAREESSTTNKTGGTGLGLSITQNIVNLMGGKISVQSKKGEGSRFDVLLTFNIDKDEPTLSTKNLLLVSNEEMLIENIKASLKYRQVELTVAKDTEEAVKVLEENNIDTILLSGYLSKKVLAKTVTKLREKAKDAMFIFCCDYAHKDQVRDMLVNSGVDGLIARPFFVENLILAIDHAQKDLPTEEREVHSSLSGKRFMCAEDNELNAEILEALLNLHGATCIIYSNGAELVEAFKTVKKGDYDAILMDVQMPVMSGIEATKVIREGENPLGKTIPILAMTANAFSSDVKDCLDAGMNAHLPKPLDITLLERTLQEISSRQGGGIRATKKHVQKGK